MGRDSLLTLPHDRPEAAGRYVKSIGHGFPPINVYERRQVQPGTFGFREGWQRVAQRLPPHGR
jgi:hypothetical protein